MSPLSCTVIVFLNVVFSVVGSEVGECL